MQIAGWQKLSLLDYPGEVATTLFAPGCPLRCPYCHNAKLALSRPTDGTFDPEEVLDYLKKRSGILDAVCISGGEALMQAGLFDYVKRIKELGYRVKLDTSGYYPDRLETLLEGNLIDYVALDVKNTPMKYARTVGLPAFQIKRLTETIDCLTRHDVKVEFRTTIVKDFHTREDLLGISRLLLDWPEIPWYWQSFVDSGTCMESGLSAYPGQDLQRYFEEIRPYRPNTVLRSIV